MPNGKLRFGFFISRTSSGDVPWVGRGALWVQMGEEVCPPGGRVTDVQYLLYHNKNIHVIIEMKLVLQNHMENDALTLCSSVIFLCFLELSFALDLCHELLSGILLVNRLPW